MIAMVLGLLSSAALLQAGVASAGGFTPSCTSPGNPCGLNIEKLVNGQDADTAPGIAVPAGSIVTFTYLVTATVPTSGISVLDDNGTPGVPADDFSPGFVGGDTVDPGLLNPGETWTFSAQETALLGVHTNIGTVGQFVCQVISCVPSFVGIDSDPASYTGVPAPASLALVGMALSAFALFGRLRSRRRTR